MEHFHIVVLLLKWASTGFRTGSRGTSRGRKKKGDGSRMGPKRRDRSQPAGFAIHILPILAEQQFLNSDSFACTVQYLEQTVLIDNSDLAWSINQVTLPSLFYISYHSCEPSPFFKSIHWISQTCFDSTPDRRIYFLLMATRWQTCSIVSVWPEVFTKAQISDWAISQVLTLYEVLMVDYFWCRGCLGVPLFTSSWRGKSAVHHRCWEPAGATVWF